MKRLSRSLLLVTLMLLIMLAGCAGGGPEAGGEENGAGGEESASDALVITQDMADSEIEMKIGTEAVVKFDQTYAWDVITTPSLVLSAVPDAVLADDEQARLVAKLNGAAVIQATGRAVCKQDNPPCDTPNRQIRIEVKVAP